MSRFSALDFARRYGVAPFLIAPVLVAVTLIAIVQINNQDDALQQMLINELTVWCHPEVKDGGQRIRVHVAGEGALWSIGRVQDCDNLRRASKRGTELVFHRTHRSIYSLRIGEDVWVSESSVRGTQLAAGVMVSVILFGMFLGWYGVLRNRIQREDHGRARATTR